MAGLWIGYAKKKLALLIEDMEPGETEAERRYALSNGVTITVSVSDDSELIRIFAESIFGAIFISDYLGGHYEYHDDLGPDHYRDGIKSFDTNAFGLKTRFDPYGHINVIYRTDYTSALSHLSRKGISYYRGQVYSVDNNGYMDVFKESGEYVEEVPLYQIIAIASGLNPNLVGRAHSDIKVRDDGKIFIGANYLIDNVLRVYEFAAVPDIVTGVIEYQYVRMLAVNIGAQTATYGIGAIALDTANRRVYSAVNAFWSDELFVINIHDMDTGVYLGNLADSGIQGPSCGGLFYHKGILYVSESTTKKINRFTMVEDVMTAMTPVIDCTSFVPAWMPIDGVAVADDGIFFTAFHGNPLSTQREVYVKKISMDGLTEIMSVGEWIGEEEPGTAPVYPETVIPSYRFHRPYGLDIKNAENP